MSHTSFEVNFDGLVGPSHHYGGLSYGNVASVSNKKASSNPREAALQGLKKMHFLASLGLKQAVLPPQGRPHLLMLKRLGYLENLEYSEYQGKKLGQLLEQVRRDSPELLSAIWSSSCMWTANAATIAPSSDSADKKVHFIPANLSSKFHRFIEAEATGRVLRAIFSDPKHFVHHEPLPSHPVFGDEGAANHTRFCEGYGKKGLHLFVYGRKGFPAPHGEAQPEPQIFPARQTREASMAVARLEGLNPSSVVYLQQNPQAIDAGAFHNDVVSVGNLNVFFYHEEAFLDSDKAIAHLAEAYEKENSKFLHLIQVPSASVTLEDAIKTYLFNSQLIQIPSEGGASGSEMALIAPIECEENPRVKAYLDRLVKDASQPIRKVTFFDLKQSMRNGGGPACLRLRVVLSAVEMKKTHPGIFLTDSLYQDLCQWVKKNYRDRVTGEDLVDPQFVDECRATLEELIQILGLPSDLSVV